MTERCRTSLDHFLKDNKEWVNMTMDQIDMLKYTILLHIAHGLEKLHDMGVLHRDIKAGNILLDGASGECGACKHSGRWKICDFGEAAVLRESMLTFSGRQSWPRGWGGHLVEQQRFQPVTSTALQEAGAKWYCWINPGEAMSAQGDSAAKPPGPTEHSIECQLEHTSSHQQWVPCRDGGFVYFFGEVLGEPHGNDCFFACTANTTASDTDHGTDASADRLQAQQQQQAQAQQAQQAPLPSLGPFRLVAVDQLAAALEIDFSARTYTISSTLDEARNSQLLRIQSKLQRSSSSGSSGGGGSGEQEATAGHYFHGTISPVHQITLTSDSAKRQAMIPTEATHFCWCYQGLATPEQRKQVENLVDGNGELAPTGFFLSLGGFVYLSSSLPLFC